MQSQLKSYSEVAGGISIDWWRELDRLEKKSIGGDDLHIRLNHLAASWVTCACGNQCEVIPREDGVPVDTELNTLGMKFYVDVRDMDISAARNTLEKIEKRSATLIARINGEKSNN